MASTENDLEFETVASIPKVTDCVGWEDQIATGHANSFIKLWRFEPSSKKLEFVLRFRHLSDSEDSEVFNEDTEEGPAKKKSFQEAVTDMMLFQVDPQPKSSNLLDLLPESESNTIIQEIREILAAKTKTPTTFLCSFVGSDIQLWNKKGEGMFSDLAVDAAVIVGDELIVEPPDGEGELCSESLLFGPPDSVDSINLSHDFGFFAASRNRQLWATTKEGLCVRPQGEEANSWNINEVLKEKGITPANEAWISPSLCEWHHRVVMSGWDHGVHIWDAVKLGTLIATLPEYHKGNPPRKIFTWKGYLCISVSAKGNDRIDFWNMRDDQLSKVGTWNLAGGNSDMEAKFFEWKGYLCALQYKTLTLYDCASLPVVPQKAVKWSPQIYEKVSKAEGERNNNNNNIKKKKTSKKKRPAKQTNNKNAKKRKSGTVDKFDEEDEYQDEYEEEEEEEPELEEDPEESEYEDEDEDDSD